MFPISLYGDGLRPIRPKMLAQESKFRQAGQHSVDPKSAMLSMSESVSDDSESSATGMVTDCGTRNRNRSGLSADSARSFRRWGFAGDSAASLRWSGLSSRFVCATGPWVRWPPPRPSGSPQPLSASSSFHTRLIRTELVRLRSTACGCFALRPIHSGSLSAIREGAYARRSFCIGFFGFRRAISGDCRHSCSLPAAPGCLEAQPTAGKEESRVLPVFLCLRNGIAISAGGLPAEHGLRC
jgi:hypothetical protein